MIDEARPTAGRHALHSGRTWWARSARVKLGYADP